MLVIRFIPPNSCSSLSDEFGSQIVVERMTYYIVPMTKCAVERHFLLVGGNPTQQLSLRLVAATLANGLTAATQQARFDPIIQEFVSELRREGVADGYVVQHPGPARHFLTWLARSGILLRTVDGTVLDCFLQHDCDCCSGVPAAALLHPWRKRRSSPEVMKFVRFLERTGSIEEPGDGFARQTIRAYRNAGAGLIVWLHLSRVRLRDLHPDVLARFRRRQFVCSIPGVFAGQRTQSPGPPTGRKFVGFSAISLRPAGSTPWSRPRKSGRSPSASRGSAHGWHAIAASARRARTSMPSWWRRCCPLSGTNPGPMTQRGSDGCCSSTSSGDRAATPGA